jgi:hypothetical protein
MASYATNITTPANAVVTALATAVSSAQTLNNNLAPGLPGTTLNNLATSTTSWKSNVGDLRTTLASAIQDLSVANQKFTAIAALLGNIGTLD